MSNLLNAPWTENFDPKSVLDEHPLGSVFDCHGNVVMEFASFTGDGDQNNLTCAQTLELIKLVNSTVTPTITIITP